MTYDAMADLLREFADYKARYGVLHPVRRIQNGCKRCNKCEDLQPFSAFPKGKDRADGHGPTCFKCRSARTAELLPDWYVKQSLGLKGDVPDALIRAQRAHLTIKRELRKTL